MKKPNKVRVGLAQINSTLGDFAGNRRKIIDFAKRASAAGCDIVVFPELALFGYLPGDLLERRSIVEQQLKEFDKLTKEFPSGLAGLVGLITMSGKKIGKPYRNSAALISADKKTKYFHKQLLPTYDVFDESRFIERGRIEDNWFRFKGLRVQVTICEDIWGWELPARPSNYLANPIASIKVGDKSDRQTDLVLNLSASPYTSEKEKDRLAVVSKTARHFKAPLAYVNMVGGQDELVFDGGSLAVDADGATLARCKRFVEELNIFDLHDPSLSARAKTLPSIEATRQALVLGIRDFALKTGLERAHLGLSGGIDSALVACLAVDALGPSRVTGVTLPGPFNPKLSRRLAQELAKNLGIRVLDAPIGSAYEAALQSVKAAYGDFEFGVVNENLQSRLRGVFLMALANKENSLLLTTGNKSEFASGYSTLYGDMCGGLAPIGDLLKREVVALCRLYNARSEVIPNEIIDRPPSAELRPNQTDQDTLPPYDELDQAVQALVDRSGPAKSATEKWLLGAMKRSEFKRWQAPPILKVSRHAFGRGRRLPIAHKADA